MWPRLCGPEKAIPTASNTSVMLARSNANCLAAWKGSIKSGYSELDWGSTPSFFKL